MPAKPPRPIPAFALYGEAGRPGADMLHVEPIQSRSALYRWEIAPHVHQGLHQIVWLRTGPAEVWLDEARQRCSGPLAIVIPPGVVHAFRFSPESDGHVLTLSPQALVEDGPAAVGSALHALFAAPQLLLPGSGADATERIDALLRELAAEAGAPAQGSTPAALWLARALVWRLARISARAERAGSPAGRAHRALFTRFVVLLEAHYLEHWPLSRYAARLGLTPERLNRLARAEAGCNALALVHARLAREACRRIVYIAAPISRLAAELGFDDPAYFCRFFKRHTGLSPRAYREAHAAVPQAA